MGIKERLLYIITIIIITTLSLISRIKFNNERLLIKETHKAELQREIDWNKTIIESEGIKIDSSILIYGIQNDTIELLNLTNYPKLVLCQSENPCGVCIDSLLADINYVFFNQPDKIVILADSRSYRNILAHVENGNYPFKTYSLVTDFELPVCDNNNTFFFLLDNDLIIKCLFIPDKKKSAKTISYLNIIQQRIIKMPTP